jgi:glutaminyl-tRNA synthetase
VPFEADLFIEREDFAEIPPPKFKRLVPGGSVRLRHAGFLTCTAVEKDEAGNVTGLVGRFAPMDAAVKVKATIHWVAQGSAQKAEVRLYDRLFTVPEPCADKERDYKEFFNGDSEKVVSAWIEPSLASAPAGGRFQFERIGYFSVDKESRPGALVFNRIATLKDSK